MGGRVEPRLKAYAGKLNVFTQLTYHGVPIDKDTTDPSVGRFDLMLRSVPENEFVIVIESKVGIDLHLNDQLKGYKDALHNFEEWREVEERYVVSLTPASCKPENADAHLSWTKVHGLLSSLAGREDEPAEHRATFNQLADFLENRGLNLIKLMRLTTEQIQSFTDSAPFFDQAHKFFARFADNKNLKNLFKPERSRVPTVECYEGDGWYGIHSLDWANYAGFYFRAGEMGLCLEVSVVGDLRKIAKPFSEQGQAAIKHAGVFFKLTPKYEEGKTTFRFSRLRENNEETDDMIAWFSICAEDVAGAALQGRNQ